MMDLPEAPAQVGIVDELLLEEQPAASTSNKEDLDAKKANVRKRTKTGCLSKFPSYIYIHTYIYMTTSSPLAGFGGRELTQCLSLSETTNKVRRREANLQ